MGNLLTRRNNRADQQQQLLDQIKQLSERVSTLDKNADGVYTPAGVSKDEFKLWQKEQTLLIDKMTLQIMQQKDQEYTEKITLLKKELEAVKKINQDLEQAIRTRHDLKSVERTTKADQTMQNSATSQGNNEKENTSTNTNQLFGEVSKLRIQEAVDRMISNENINIGYLPDIVERQMYKNVFNILLNMLNEVSDGVSIKVLGHEITMEMKAIGE